MILKLIDDGAASLRALTLVAAGREDWADRADASTEAFLRSFVGALLAIPFAIYADAPFRRALELPPAPGLIVAWTTLAASVLYLIGFPWLLALIVSRLGGGQGFGRFVIQFNWMQLWLNAIIAAIGFLLAVGLPNVVASGFWIGAMAISLYLTWRLARETLTGEVGLSLAVVLLSLACNQGSTFAVDWLAGVIG